MDFTEMFKKATLEEKNPEGVSPYPYQIRLAQGESFPSFLEAPTGMGKTAAVILAWLWRRRFADEAVRKSTPRRLVYCLPMRVLVEQTRDCAEGWLKNLGVLAEKAPAEHPAEKVAVHVLMGGDLELDWDRWPERDQILIGTQDMLLSRALNRGYAMSRFRWPVHFGLLNNDCLWVMDEVQLMGNGLATTAQLQAFRRMFGTVLPVRSLWMSATINEGWLKTVDFLEGEDGKASLTLSEEDLVVLRKRWEAVKGVEIVDFTTTKDDGKREAELALEAHVGGTRTLIIVNTVKRAQQIFQALKKKKPKAKLILIHSRFRPLDRQKALDELLAEPGETGTLAVCTQVVEAGVDVSARLLITDLAPWASLVQRFGRCNRRGEWNDKEGGLVKVLLREKLEAAPYSAEELQEAKRLLEGIDDVGPRNLPKVQEEMFFTHVVRRKDIVDLFDTTPDLAGADLDISRYIRETDDSDVQVFWRNIENSPEADERRPTRNELCGVPVGDFRKWLEKGDRRFVWRWDHLEGGWVKVKSGAVYPGLVLLLKASEGGYDSESGWTAKDSDKPPTDQGVATPESNDTDPDTGGREWETIAEHTDRVVHQLGAILDETKPSLEPWREELLEAARWHDVGKAHEIFQKAMPEGAAPGNDLWAKAKPRMKRYGRPGFRHELASALAMLAQGLTGLPVYLSAAHHGKVRLSIRSLPHEKPPVDDLSRRYARGVWEGDELPEVDLGGGTVSPKTILNLVYMELGESETTGPSWLARMLALRDAPNLGLFRLAFLESLLRVADWRASGVAEAEEEER